MRSGAPLATASWQAPWKHLSDFQAFFPCACAHTSTMRSGAPLATASWQAPWKHLSDLQAFFTSACAHTSAIPNRGPRIPPGQPDITSTRRTPQRCICRFFHLNLRFSMSQRPGLFCENLDAGEICTFRLPLSECDACGLLRAPHSTAQAPIKSSKSMQGRHENENLQASKKS